MSRATPSRTIFHTRSVLVDKRQEAKFHSIFVLKNVTDKGL